MLKPFKQYYQLIDEHDEEMEQLWKALDEAEKGNEQKLLENIDEMIEESEDDLDDLKDNDPNETK